MQGADELRAHYKFDYRKAKPNRFASRFGEEAIAVVLDPDVAAVFTTSEEANQALRVLIDVLGNLAETPDLLEKVKSSMPQQSLHNRSGPDAMHFMLPDYDFTDGVRGKHHKAFREGHTVKVHMADGTTGIHYFTLEDDAVMLEPDVRQRFPDSDAVNKALRALISLVPEKRKSPRVVDRTPIRRA